MSETVSEPPDIGASISHSVILGFALLARRKQQGLSQINLAQKSGVSQATISRIEAGEADMTVSQVNALCDALNLTVSELFSAAEEIEHQLEDRNIEVEPIHYRHSAHVKLPAAAAVAGLFPMVGLNPVGWMVGAIALNVLRKSGLLK